jgi:hypothetical protein
MGTAALIKEMSGKSISVIDSTNSTNEAISCPDSNTVDISVGVLNIPDGQIEMSLHPIQHRPSVKMHFLAEF